MKTLTAIALGIWIVVGMGVVSLILPAHRLINQLMETPHVLNTPGIIL